METAHCFFMPLYIPVYCDNFFSLNHTLFQIESGIFSATLIEAISTQLRKSLIWQYIYLIRNFFFISPRIYFHSTTVTLNLLLRYLDVTELNSSVYIAKRFSIIAIRGIWMSDT